MRMSYVVAWIDVLREQASGEGPALTLNFRSHFASLYDVDDQYLGPYALGKIPKEAFEHPKRVLHAEEGSPLWPLRDFLTRAASLSGVGPTGGRINERLIRDFLSPDVGTSSVFAAGDLSHSLDDGRTWRCKFQAWP